MKKKFPALVFLVLVFCLLLSGCNKNGDEYFNTFSSRGAFSSAEKSLELSAGVGVERYDVENNVFVTVVQVLNSYDDSEYIRLYGFASDDKEYVSPIYTHVLEINGDYAVVTKPASVTGIDGKRKLAYMIGVIRFRGDVQIKELTDFNVEHDESKHLYSFVGDYIKTVGVKESPDININYSTFYDYSRGSLLEVFKVRCGAKYDFQIYDKYLAAVGDDHAFFYDTDAVLTNGFLNIDDRGIYIAYPEDEKGEYTDMIDVDVHYLGNGWFTRTARLESASKFEGYNMIYEKTDPSMGTSQTVYANVRCDLYDCKTRSTTEKEWLLVENVANVYSADYYSQIASYLNSLATFDESNGRYEYALPYMDISKLVKNGYSIVYYYYLPYVDSGSYQSEITFCIMDEKANVINIKDMLMPTVIVDGVGISTSDPMYEEYVGGIYSFDKKSERKELLVPQNGVNTYVTYLYHERAIVASELIYSANSRKFGAVTPEGRILLPFIYDELSPFYGGYCMGMRTENGTARTYRVAADGAETPVTDVVNIKQGVYVFDRNGKLGLKNYAGDIIMDAEYEKLEVLEIFLTKDTYQFDYVVATKDGVTAIYKLN